MCDPVTIMVVSTVVAGGMQAMSQQQQGKYSNNVAKYNARLSENEAVRVRNKGTEAEMAHRQETSQLISRQRATLGASDIDINDGSALQLQTDAALLGEVDALRIRSNFSDQARTLDDQALLTRNQGKMAKRAGDMAMIGTLIGTAGQAANVSSSWMTPNSAAAAGATSGDYTGSQMQNWVANQRAVR